MRAAAQGGTGEQFSLDDFVERATARPGVDELDAVFHARVVLQATGEAATGGLVPTRRLLMPQGGRSQMTEAELEQPVGP